MKNKKQDETDSRSYRNSRLGDFLKELGLTEGRATGIPKIRHIMNQNGSPEPKFETDMDRTNFLTTLYVHPYFEDQALTNLSYLKKEREREMSPGVSPGVSPVMSPVDFSKENVFQLMGIIRDSVTFMNIFRDNLKENCTNTVVDLAFVEIFVLCCNPMSFSEIQNHSKDKNRNRVRKKIVSPLLDCSLIEWTIPDEPNNPKQKYVLTEKGKNLLNFCLKELGT